MGRRASKGLDFIKESLTSVPLLAYPDPNVPYILYTDASDTCIGSCLTQTCEGEDKPIYYLSHKLSRSQCKWSTVEKEAYAIHFSLQKLDYYLHNAEFVIKTDHKPLKYLLESPMQNRKIQLWALSMAGYNCIIVYIEGTTNTCADLLSRHPDNVGLEKERNGNEVVLDVSDNSYQINVLDSSNFDPKAYASCQLPENDSLEKVETSEFKDFDMYVEQSKDDDLTTLRSKIESGDSKKENQKHYLIVDNLLCYISNTEDDLV